MARYVIKLGSSIVAEDSGELRADVIERICAEAAARHAAGHDVVLVTSGAIARGMRVMDLPVRPRADRGAAGRERRRAGQALPRLRRAAARPRDHERAGAADVLRHERAHALPQRAPDARQAARVARAAGHQRERHDDDRRDLLRRQRLPRGAGGDAHRRRPARAADRRRGAVHGSAAGRPRRAARPRGHGLRGARRRWTIGHTTSPLGTGGMRSKVVAAEMATAGGHRDRHLQRPARGRAGAPRSTARRAARASRRARSATRRSSSG